MKGSPALGQPQNSTRQEISVVVVEDEPLARAHVCRIIGKRSEFTVLGEAGDGHEALKLIRKVRPHIVLLDIRLPGMDGFGVISSLGAEVPPVVIFMTACGDKAVEAFQVGAIDYLLKPFDAPRLDQALDRAQKLLQSPDSTNGTRKSPAALGRIAVKVGIRFIFVNLVDIEFVASEGNRSIIHTPTGTMRTNEGLGDLLSRLPADKFVRNSRTEAVNLSKIKSIHPKTHGDMTILLQNGESRVLTRTRRAQVMDLLARL